VKLQLQRSLINVLKAADYVSLINAIFGFLSILMVFLEEFYYAFVFILIGILVDGLDGIVSRKYGSSKAGCYFDSISDTITMGVAVSVFMFGIYFNDFSDEIFYKIFFILLILFFLSCNIIRLSTFEIFKEKKIFKGLPAPASAILLVTISYLNIDINVVMIFLFIISILMITNVCFIKPNIKIDVITAILIILTIFIGKNFNNIMLWVLLISIIIYIILSPIFCMKIK